MCLPNDINDSEIKNSVAPQILIVFSFKWSQISQFFCFFASKHLLIACSFYKGVFGLEIINIEQYPIPFNWCLLSAAQKSKGM